MKRTDLSELECPIARSVDDLGDWWSLMILRDALDGIRRFDEFAEDLPIAPGMLSRRLRTLVDKGLLEKRRYSERPPRDEYVLTARGRSAQTVVLALLAWGNAELAPEDRFVTLRDLDTGREIEPVMTDAASGTPVARMRLHAAPGPAASAPTRERFARLDERRRARRAQRRGGTDVRTDH
ncbi:DNA-binding HxlR family transcriptional regulator [Mumia flava]|uniref:DNA-binding HxlR family transcriptional regulator n=1 Tax=Mumia flava TaxID=1348852 RepID=A0A2M9ARF0_9ACTN|nr:helix-turn-helix domain-containing protein [Mumia flava]PJJ48270.1 DNA-binding HxlR family transcriptional regulator [Mumia flava]